MEGMGLDGGHWTGRHRIGARQRSEVSSSQGKRQKERKNYKEKREERSYSRKDERRRIMLATRRLSCGATSRPRCFPQYIETYSNIFRYMSQGERDTG